MQLPMARGAYKRGDGPDLAMVNMMFEVDPREIKTQTSLYPRPGMSQFANPGAGPIRGRFCERGSLSDVALVVSGSSLYKVTSAAVATQITGTIAGTGLVSIAGNASIAYIASGTTLYSTDGATLSTVSFPDGADCTSVSYINGYFLFSRGGSHRFYWLLPGSTTIDPLDYLSAENAPDWLEAVQAIGDDLMLAGKSTLEFWDPTGDPDFPFIRIGARMFSIGCTNRQTIVQANGLVFFVGDDRFAGGRRLYRMQNAEPVAVSDAGIDERLAAATAANLRAWVMAVAGHTLIIICTGTETLVHDATTNVPTTFQSNGLTYFRGHLGFNFADGKIIACDAVNGKLWLMDPALNTDDAGIMLRQWPARAAIDSATACSRLTLDCSTGSTSSPTVSPVVKMRFSDDLGHTWSDWLDAPLGVQGAFSTIVYWTQLGLMRRPGRDFQFKVEDDVKVIARLADINGSFA